MATPHVAGGAALLKERHPTWTVEQIKSALESTGDPVHVPGTLNEVTSTREGGGRIDLARADNPLIFTDPTGVSFGLVKRGATVTQQLATADAGGGSAPWTVSVTPQSMPRGAVLVAGSPTVAAGSPLALTLTTTATAAEGEATGFVTLTRGTDVRRVPFWFRVEVPLLGEDPQTPIAKPGRLPRRHRREGVTRLPLPLSGARDHRRRPDESLRAGAGLPRRARPARRELRRRRARPREGRLGLAADRPRRRREPPRRLRRAPGRDQPVRRPAGRPIPSSPRSCRHRAPTTSSSTLRPAAGRAASPSASG